MGFPLAAPRRVVGHDLAHRHDVVPSDLFRRERSKDPDLHHRLRDSPDHSEHGHHRADRRPVRTEPIPSGMYNMLVTAIKPQLTLLGESCRVLPLHVDSITSRWLGPVSVADCPDHCWLCSRRYELCIHCSDCF